MNQSEAYAVASQFIEDVLTVRTLRGDAIMRLTRVLQQVPDGDAHNILLGIKHDPFPQSIERKP